MIGIHVYFNQVISAIIASLSVLSVGCAVGWTTPTIKKLKKSSDPIHISNSESSWLAGTHELGHIISPIPAGFLMSRYGRKPCLFLSSFLCFIGWILVAFTESIVILYFVRLLFGLAMGIVFTVVPVYVGEVSDAQIRGALSTLFQLALNGGHLIEFSVGPYVGYKELAWISLTISLLFLIFGPFLVESPQYMIVHDEEKARKSLKWLNKITDVEMRVAVLKSMATEKLLFFKIYLRYNC